MGFLGKLFGKSPKDKTDLIKDLIIKRIENDPFSKAILNVEDLSNIEMMGLPEATIVTIVESYELMTKKQGLSHEEAIELIETHRALSASGELPTPLTLSSYIKYRIKLDHPIGFPPSDKSIEDSIKEAKSFFKQFF